MSMSDYELSLVVEAKKGKKKAMDRLYDSFHKKINDVVFRELGDRSRAETIQRAVFEKVKIQIKNLANPADFEGMVLSLTAAECKNYPRCETPIDSSGSSQFEAYESSAKKEQNNNPNNAPDGFVTNAPQNTPAEEYNIVSQNEAYNSEAKTTYAFGNSDAQSMNNIPPQNTNNYPQQRVVNSPVQGVNNHPASDLNSPKEPIVAWLVCVNGMDRGREFAIREKINIIGSSPNNDIQINGEPSVAPENHACIAYDSESTACLLLTGAMGAVCLNGEFNDYPQPLNKFDIITIGNAQFVFAPVSEGLGWKRDFGL